MRPSKFRLPDRTATAFTPWRRTASAACGCSGPELPMQVVQPYPAIVNPRADRAGDSPAASRYSRTAREPGARDVFTQAGTVRPRATALRASSPASRMLASLEVLVQLVIAAIATAPSAGSSVDE